MALLSFTPHKLNFEGDQPKLAAGKLCFDNVDHVLKSLENKFCLPIQNLDFHTFFNMFTRYNLAF